MGTHWAQSQTGNPPVLAGVVVVALSVVALSTASAIGATAQEGSGGEEPPAEEEGLSVDLPPLPEGLGGFNASAESSVAYVRVGSPTLPLPTLFEGALPLSRVGLETGPSSSALSSLLWPGPVAENPNAALAQLDLPIDLGALPPLPEYPVRAQVRGFGDTDQVEQEPLPGARQQAAVDGASAQAQTNFTRLGLELIATVEAGQTTARVDTEDDLLVAHSVSTGGTVSLFGGIIRVEGVRSEAIAASNGEAAQSDSAVTFGSVSVMEQEYALGGEGLGSLPLGTINEQLAPLGLEMAFADELTSSEEAAGDASATGLRVTFAATDQMNDAQQQVTGEFGRLVGQLPLPAELTGGVDLLLSLAAAKYEVDVVVGRSTASANATPGFVMPSPPTGGTDTSEGAAPPPVSEGTDGSIDGSSSVGSPLLSTPPPQVAAPDRSSSPSGSQLPSTTPPQVAAPATSSSPPGGMAGNLSSNGINGVSPLLLLGGLLAALVVSRRLSRFAVASVATGPGGCALTPDPHPVEDTA